jgi:hypothetical protein
MSDKLAAFAVQERVEPEAQSCRPSLVAPGVDLTEERQVNRRPCPAVALGAWPNVARCPSGDTLTATSRTRRR